MLITINTRTLAKKLREIIENNPEGFDSEGVVRPISGVQIDIWEIGESDDDIPVWTGSSVYGVNQIFDEEGEVRDYIVSWFQSHPNFCDVKYRPTFDKRVALRVK